MSQRIGPPVLAASLLLAAPAPAQTRPARPARTPTAAPAPTPAPGKPDLVVSAFDFTGPKESGGVKPPCDPNTVVYSFAVTVSNQGTGPSPSSASLGGKALLSVLAQDRAGWGASVPLPQIAAGKSATVSADVLFLAADPTYMVKANHPFLATVDPDHLVAETDATNNTKGPLTMGPPAGCERLVKRK